MKFHFSRQTDEDLVLVSAQLDGDELRLALDTAATHTVMDTNSLLILGHEISSDSEIVPLETSNGIIEARKIKVLHFSALGLERSPYELLAYDFLLAGIASPYDGLLGLDFFQGTVLTIDFRRQTLECMEDQTIRGRQ